MKRSCLVRPTWLIIFVITSHVFTMVSSRDDTVEPLEYFSWKYLEWNYDNQEDENNAIKSGAYKRDNAIPGGFAIWRDKIFITVPRLLSGVPSTLNWVPITPNRPNGGDVSDANSEDKSPKLTPYPSWSYNDLGGCDDNVISAFRIEVDQCDRLWVFDAGSFWTDAGLTNQCTPRLIVFDLLTNRAIRRYDLPLGFVPKGSLIANIAVDSDPKSCDDTFAYLSSVRANSLMIYEWRTDSSWLLPIEKTFEFRPCEDYFDIRGMTISHNRNFKSRMLLLHPFNGPDEYGVFVRELRHKANALGVLNKFLMHIQKHSNYSSSSTSANGITFYSDPRNNAVRFSRFRNNQIVKFDNLNVAIKSDERLIYPIEIKVYANTLWILSNRMAAFLRPGLNNTDVNFRLSKVPVSSMNIARISHLTKKRRLERLVLGKKQC